MDVEMDHFQTLNRQRSKNTSSYNTKELHHTSYSCTDRRMRIKTPPHIAIILALVLLLTAAPTRAGNGISRLVIAHDANYPPFSYLDESNQPKGYLIDIWRAFGKANSIEIQFKLGTWQESLDMVKNGEATVHGGLFFSSERDHYLDYGPTIADLSTYLYARNKADKMCAVGVVRGGYEEHFMRKELPKRHLTLFEIGRAHV